MQRNFFHRVQTLSSYQGFIQKTLVLGAVQLFLNSISRHKTVPYAAYGTVLCYLPTFLLESRRIFCVQKVGVFAAGMI